MAVINYGHIMNNVTLANGDPSIMPSKFIYCVCFHISHNIMLSNFKCISYSLFQQNIFIYAMLSPEKMFNQYLLYVSRKNSNYQLHVWLFFFA